TADDTTIGSLSISAPGTLNLSNTGTIQGFNGIAASGNSMSVNGPGMIKAVSGTITFTSNASSNGFINFNSSQTFQGAPVTISTSASGSTGTVRLIGSGTLVSGDADLTVNSA